MIESFDVGSCGCRFASRARNIKNTATVNEVLSDGALLKRYVKQIDRLTSKITVSL